MHWVFVSTHAYPLMSYGQKSRADGRRVSTRTGSFDAIFLTSTKHPAAQLFLPTTYLHDPDPNCGNRLMAGTFLVTWLDELSSHNRLLARIYNGLLRAGSGRRTEYLGDFLSRLYSAKPQEVPRIAMLPDSECRKNLKHHYNLNPWSRSFASYGTYDPRLHGKPGKRGSTHDGVFDSSI